MGFVDIILYVSIAIMYNLFVHNLASLSYKDLQYEEKHQNTIVMVILFGGIGILISKIMNDKHKKYKNSFVSKGLYYGGILLLTTALFANWETIAEEMKLLFFAGGLGLLIWYGYRRENTIDIVKKKKELDAKLNEEVISEVINDKKKPQTVIESENL
ncbi:hypothetical protein QKU48_gp0728 [Fadolivirus algeromassiliense]|jgi:hypothetical protein|uniref:Uncharacterized protein n=1 Tax=Fadolivirus FV1/VV64 TaxID=3070911 RepID=A0A7D3QW52_9VIRU|nr:hypothetical protein QKU48_gp0728 [Fadolivirus algeromassiliense]QKF94186.1 hypothetical protein Fadolivirus_1_728 [Fadolivirus FV1/VV64]